MGDPKKSRKKYRRPKNPWSEHVLRESNRLAGLYGLRNKQELWRIMSMARKYKGIARKLMVSGGSEREREEAVMGRLRRMGLLKQDATIDNVLDVKPEHILERRLQTLVWRKGFAKTPYMARQLIVHGKVRVAGRRIRQPGYLVPVQHEDVIECALPVEEVPVREEAPAQEAAQ